MVSHYTGKDFFAVADLCGNIKSEWSTLTQAKEHKTSESEKIIAVDCIQVWSVHDAEGRNVTGLWYPYESRALAVLYKKVNPKYWTEFVSKELQDIAEEKIDFFNYNSFKIYDRLKPIYDAASIVNFNISCMTSTQKAGKSLNELIDLGMSYTNVVDFCVMCCKDDLELLPLMKQAVIECYKLRFDNSNQISTLRVNRYPDIEGIKESYIPINKSGERIGVEVYDSESQAVNTEGCKYVYRLDSGFHYKVIDNEGNIIGRDIYEDELEALVFLYKRSNPTSWVSYYSNKYKEI